MNISLRSPALSESVTNYIQDYIVINKLKAGDPLPSEGQLAELLGVSRSPVREAVKALQSLGIIEARQGDGLYVREWNFDAVLQTLSYGVRINPKTIFELYQIRVWLEISVIGDVIKLISDEQINGMETLMQDWEQAIAENQPWVAYDEAFHKLILDVIDNETLVKLFKVFWLAFENYEETELLQASSPQEVLSEHLLIFDAVKKRNADLARKTLLAQFVGFMERINRIVAQKNQRRVPVIDNLRR